MKPTSDRAQTQKQLPKRLWLAVPYSDLGLTLVSGARRGRVYRTKREALAAKPKKTAAVGVHARAAEADGVRFTATKTGWKFANSVAPHYLTCRDRRVLKALDVDRAVSAGGIIVSSLANPRVLLMRREASGRVSWKTPKGHRERGESRKQTARREVREESGLKEIRIVDYVGRMQYFKQRDGKLSEKTVHLYLMHHTPGEATIAPRKGEHFVDGEWLTFDDAASRITQPHARALVTRAGRRLAKRRRSAAASGAKAPEASA